MDELTQITFRTFMYEMLEADNERLRKRISELETKDLVRLERENNQLRDAISHFQSTVKSVMEQYK